MCGAFSIIHPFKELGRPFNAGYNGPTIQPRYNARPGQLLPVILNTKPDEVILASWGLTPPWSKGRAIINARAETLDEKVTFHKLLERRRCLIPADGFYEWGNLNGKKQPFRFVLKTQEVFMFAGLWDITPETKEPQFTIITTQPNDLVAKVHDRMPVILPKSLLKKWIGENEKNHGLLRMLNSYPTNLMEGYPVSTLVNKAVIDSPEIIKRITLSNGLS